MCRPVVTHHWRCNHNTTLAATVCDTRPCTFATTAFVRPGSPLCGECRQPDSAFRRAAAEAEAEAEARYVAQAMILLRYGTGWVQCEGRDRPRAESAAGETQARERDERVRWNDARRADDRLAPRREGRMRLSEVQEREAQRERERKRQLGAAWQSYPRRASAFELRVRFEWHERP